MSNDTKGIIGTMVVLAALLSAHIASVNTRIDDSEPMSPGSSML